MKQRPDMTRKEQCAPYKAFCPIHNVHHHVCADCGQDCTLGTPGGPGCTETDGITRCWKCNGKLDRCQYVGEEATVARAAVKLFRAAKEAQEKAMSEYDAMLAKERMDGYREIIAEGSL